MKFFALSVLIITATRACAFRTSVTNEIRVISRPSSVGHSSITPNPQTILAASTRTAEPSIGSSTNAVRRETQLNRPNPRTVVDFSVPKNRDRLNLPRLAARLDQEVYEKEWFITGQVNPRFFHPDFHYRDADVEIGSLEQYAQNVFALFDQSCSRAEVVETCVNPEREKTITCTWRCSGRANLWWGVDIKPFIVTTHWEIDGNTGLIYRQTDEYSLPIWDLLVSAFLPFLNGIVTAPPAPPVSRRCFDPVPTVSRSPFQSWAAKSGFKNYFQLPLHSHPETGNPLDDFVEFLTEDKSNFLNWNPPKIDKRKLITPYDPESLPTIRAPTLWDRMQAFVPDNAELLENLHEATRRTESRRARRYYYSLVEGGERQNAQDEREPVNSMLAP